MATLTGPSFYLTEPEVKHSHYCKPLELKAAKQNYYIVPTFALVSWQPCSKTDAFFSLERPGVSRHKVELPKFRSCWVDESEQGHKTY